MTTTSRGTVIHVIDSLGRGGAEAALVAGLPALKQQGWDVSVVALGPPDMLANDLRARGVPVEFGKLALLRRLRQLRRARPIVHSHLFFANAVTRLAGAATRLPLLTTLHNPDYGAEGPGRFGLRFAIDRALLAVKRPVYISVSDAVREDYAKTLGISSVVCPNPVDPFWLGPAPSKAEARQRLGVGDGPLVFACGRLHKQKGFDLLARAARGLPHVRFAIAGGGPDANLIKQNGPVELVGSLVRTQVRDWIVAADLVVIPSRWESFGVFALEAMALGAPILASDIPGLRDTLSGCAHLVPPDDEAALATALADLLARPDERRRLGALGAAQAPAFSADIWARRHGELYEQHGHS